ncbi:hypothetical protein Tco_1059871 [Tanacetum coccineum]
MMNTKYNHSKGDMKVDAKSSSSGEEYDKVFNHLDMLNASFERKVFTFAKQVKPSVRILLLLSLYYYCYFKFLLLEFIICIVHHGGVVAWHETRIEGLIMLKKYQQVHGDLKGRLLEIIDLMIQKDQDRHHGILEDDSRRLA